MNFPPELLNLSGTACKTYLVLCMYPNSPQKAIAEMVGVTERTIRRVITELRDVGVLPNRTAIPDIQVRFEFKPDTSVLQDMAVLPAKQPLTCGNWTLYLYPLPLYRYTGV